MVGGLWYALALLGRLVLPQALCTAWTAALPFLLTGFMHLDGFMDTADALLSWRPLEQRQKILKDVHCGSFSVVAVLLLILGMYASASDLGKKDLRPLVLIPAASRCLSAFCVSAIRPIGHSEYAAMERMSFVPLSAAAMLVLTILAGLLWCGTALPLFFTVLGYCAAMFFAVRTMKGVSGDLAGYSLCIGELAGVAALAIF